MTRDQKLLCWIEDIARDVGRLRRRLEPGSSLAHTADRIASKLETLDAILYPPAAELAAASAPGREDAIVEAIRIVDEHERRLRQLLGTPA